MVGGSWGKMVRASGEVGEAKWRDLNGFRKRVLRGVEAGTLDLVIRVEPGPRLVGRIVDREGTPVPHAQVMVLPKSHPAAASPSTLKTKTDKNGRFELRGLDPGPFDLGVFARNFVPGVFPTRPGTTGDFRLERGLAVAGRILDAEGQPAPEQGIQFQLIKPARPDEVAPWKRKGQTYLPHFHATSDRDGRFRCTGLLDGEYRLEEPRDVPALVFAAGQTDLDLRIRKLLTITGYVVDEHGQPALSNGKTRLKISAKFQRRQVGYIPLEDDGGFRFERVPEGDITLNVSGRIPSARRLHRRQPLGDRGRNRSHAGTRPRRSSVQDQAHWALAEALLAI